MKKVAIFDVDGTIFRSSLLIEFVEALAAKGVISEEAPHEYAREYEAWRNRNGSYDAYIGAVVDTFLHNIKGVFYGDFKDIADAVIEEQKHRVYRYTRDLVQALKKDNYFILAISQSPKTILDPFCLHMGFDKVYGRLYELGPQDRFTGEIIDLHLIANKANVLKRAVEKEHLTLEGSVGVGDTDGDIPFLELVDKPICFNPNDLLYKEAKRRNWQVVVERKNVIYEL